MMAHDPIKIVPASDLETIEDAGKKAGEKGLAAGLDALEEIVNGGKVGTLADRAWSSAQDVLRKRRNLKGPGAKERLARFRLPGDALFLCGYEPVKNYKPFIFLPCFIFIWLVEGLAFQQETSLQYSDGTPFTDSPSNADERKDRQALFDSGNLTCVYGNPEEYIHDAGLWCPFVLAHRSEVAYPLMWFTLLIITILICYVAALSERKKGNLQIRPGESLIGAYLQIYRAGYTDGHLHLWLVSWTSNLVFAILSRRASRSRSGDGSHKHGCVRWGNWEGHWDECESILATDTSPCAWALILIFICFLGSLVDQGHRPKNIPCPEDRPKEVEEMDTVTAAAVKLKTLVRQQMAATRSRKQIDGVPPWELPKAILNIFLQLLSNISIEVQPDFMDDFSDQLEDIISPLTKPLADLTDKAKTVLESINAKVGSQLERGEELTLQAVEQLIQEKAAPKLQESEALVKVNVVNLLEQVEERFRPARQRYFAFQAATIIGVFVSCLLYVFLLLQPLGAQVPAMHGDGFAGDRCEDSAEKNVWCNGFSTGGNSIRYIFYFREIEHLFKGGVRALTVMCLIFKFVTLASVMALFQVTINKTWEGLDDAGQPMQIMGDILSSWAQAGSVTSKQLQAWKMARRSLLYNEVALTLDRWENVIAGYLLVMLTQTAILLLHVIVWHRDPDFFSIVGFGYCAVATFTCISRAMTCYYGQKGHLKTLGYLKETLLATQRPEHTHAATIKYIDQIRESLANSDYQAYLFYIPLNPLTQKALTGYAASGIAALVGRYVLQVG